MAKASMGRVKREIMFFIFGVGFSSIVMCLVYATTYNRTIIVRPSNNDMDTFQMKPFTSNISNVPATFSEQLFISDSSKVRETGENKYIKVFNASNEGEEVRMSVSKHQCVLYRTRGGTTNICVHPREKDIWVSGNIISHGSWEGGLVDFIANTLNEDPGMSLLDMGCNIGVFTIYIAKLGRRVVGVDASKENLLLLSRSLTMGNLHENVTLIWNALSDTHENVILKEYFNNKGGTYVEPSTETDPTKTVSTIMLDDLVSMFSTGSLFIKMDIEGSEWRALNGGKQFFKAVNVRYVLMEFVSHSKLESGKYICNFLSDNGFRPYKPTGRREDVLDIAQYNSWPNNVLWAKEKHLGPSNSLIVPAAISNIRETGENKYIKLFNATNESEEVQAAVSKHQCVLYRTRGGTTNICVHPREKDIWVSGHLLSYGSWENELVELIANTLNEDPGMSLLDLGCNIGVFTIYFAKLGRRVVGVDASKENLLLLSRSLTMGNLHENVTLIWNALSDIHENVILKEYFNNKGGTYVEPSTETDPTKTVSTIMLDDLVSMFSTGSFFIKMDIEGFEWRALNGGKQFFKTVDVRYVLMEFMFHSKLESGKYICDFFSDNGFRPYKTTGPRGQGVLDVAQYNSWPNNVLWVKEKQIGRSNSLIAPVELSAKSFTSAISNTRERGEHKYIKLFNATNESEEVRASVSKHQCVLYRTRGGTTNICVYPREKDIWVSGNLLSYGSWEIDLVDLIAITLTENPRMSLLDLGCNIGVFTIYFAKMGRRVVGVDASKENLLLLSRSLTMGNLHQNVTLIWNALSDTHENVILKETLNNKGGTYVEPSTETDPTTTVSTIMLDELAAMFSSGSLFIKMDIEGFEWRALNGGKQFFKTVDVRYVLMEFMFHSKLESGKYICDFFSDNGFRPYKTTGPRGQRVLDIAQYNAWPNNVLWMKEKDIGLSTPKR